MWEYPRKLKAISWTLYLCKGKAVFVSFLVFHLVVIKCFALRWGLRQRFDDLHEVGGEKAVDPIDFAVVPILIHLSSQNDDVAFAELQVSRLFSFVVI